MTRPPHRPGAGILLLTVATAFGAAAGLFVDGILWMTQSGNSVGDAWERGTNVLEEPNTLAWTLVASGACLAFVWVGWRRGTFRYLHVAIGTTVLLILAIIVGAVIGALTYVGTWAVRVAGIPAQESLTVADEAILAAPRTFLLFVAAGAAVAVTVTAFVLHNRTVQGLGSGLLGAIFGVLAGLVLFAISAVTVDRPQAWTEPDWVLDLGEKVASLEPVEIVFAGFGAVVGLVVARNRWRFYGVVTFVSLLSVIGGFLAYSLFVTLPRVDPERQRFAWTLFIAETASLGMVLLYSFYTIDVTSRTSWRRTPEGRVHSPHFLPKVAFQVPCYNEPAEIVIPTLEALLRVDYPKDRYLIMVLDDSTDATCADPLEAFCRDHDLVYLNRDERSGYKAGALNYGLREAPKDVEIFAIIDADYQVKPEYLRETVGYFIDPDLGWVQTPQAYRNPDQSFLTKQYYLADAYFYRTVMPSRNEENTIIFAGTMGLVRKEAITEVGGWGEKYITEDAELSLRLLLHGYSAVYFDRTYGRGLIPATFDGYKKQHYRWAFGGARILRGHLHHLLFGRLTRRQAFDYFVGSVHWFEGLFILLIALLIITIATAQLVGVDLATHHSEEILLIGLIPFFVLTDGLARLHTVMRGTLNLSFLQTLRILGMWFSVKFSNAMAATKGFIGFSIPFVRTPKAPTERIGRGEAVRRALRIAPFESVMASILLILAIGLGMQLQAARQFQDEFKAPVAFLLFWVLYYFLVFVSAPLYAYKSYVTFRPEKEEGEVMMAPPRPRPAGAHP